MANKSKQKGDREERSVVEFFRDNGIYAQRTLEAGARSDGSNTWDIDVYFDGIEGAARIGECKMRKEGSGFKQIYKWMGENDFLTIRMDRSPRLFVLSEEFFLDLIKGGEG